MERRTRSRNCKLSGKRSVEVKVSKEITPTKAIIPQAHSTPVESKVVSKSDESNDSDEEPDICFTQDMLEVQWDYSNTPNRKEKKKRSKPKRKSKGSTFTKNKKWQEFSPNGAVFFRKRFIKEEPKADLTKLIVGLQAIAEKVKEEQGVCKNGIQKDLHYIEHLNDDIDRSVGAKTARKQLLAPSSPQKELVTKTVSENYTSLFDDDEDDCIVRCSQEIEQKLHEPNAIECTTKEKCSLDSMTLIPTKNSDLDENKPENCKYNNFKVPPVLCTKHYFRIKSKKENYLDDKFISNYQIYHGKINVSKYVRSRINFCTCSTSENQDRVQEMQKVSLQLNSYEKSCISLQLKGQNSVESKVKNQQIKTRHFKRNMKYYIRAKKRNTKYYIRVKQRDTKYYIRAKH